jgi:hypothetical protein
MIIVMRKEVAATDIQMLKNVASSQKQKVKLGSSLILMSE